MYLGNIAGLVIVLATVPLFAAIMRIPFSFVAPVILIVCAIGAYTISNSIFDIWLMLIFGVVGYLFKKLDYPLAPMILALVLGDRAEDAFRQALLGSGGSLGIFWANGLVTTLVILALLLLCWGPASDAIAALRGRGRTDPETAEATR
jgi:TctA family transporter